MLHLLSKFNKSTRGQRPNSAPGQAGIDVAAQLRELGERISRLEQNRAEVVISQEAIGETLRSLGKKLVDFHPNTNYFNERFRDYELALLTIKNLGYHLGKQLYDKNAAKVVSGPKTFPLVSKPCTQNDMESEWFGFWCNEIKSAPHYHRKLWEFCYIAQAVFNEGKLRLGNACLGFGCGEEPLTSLFAKYGASVLATDLDKDRQESEGWRATGQHVSAVESVRRRDICADEARLAGISFRPVDMNAIPADLNGKFDFCWSACSLEHLGSLEKGLLFIENSLQCLKPGGIAVHTTEWNISDGETIDNWGTVLYQRQHFETLIERLRNRGYLIVDPDFDTGDGVIDHLIDVPPYPSQSKFAQHSVHLKLSVDGFICTSFGLIIKAPG